MGWQDRDWAKWTDEERVRYVGGGGSGAGVIPGALLAIIVSLVATVVLTHPFRSAHPTPPPVYGSGVVEQLMGNRTTCTKMELVSGRWTCEVWSFLLPGQQALPAAPPSDGNLCTIVVVDQPSRRWVCVAPS